MSAMLKSSIQSLGLLSDPDEQKAQILREVGDLSDGEYDILDDHVLVAHYVTPNTMDMKRSDGTTYKFHLTDNKVAESQFQGKAYLILKIGPTAFKYLPNGQAYEGTVPEVGDWAIVQPSDGKPVGIKALESREHTICKLVPDRCIKQRVKDPRRIW